MPSLDVRCVPRLPLSNGSDVSPRRRTFRKTYTNRKLCTNLLILLSSSSGDTHIGANRFTTNLQPLPTNLQTFAWFRHPDPGGVKVSPSRAYACRRFKILAKVRVSWAVVESSDAKRLCVQRSAGSRATADYLRRRCLQATPPSPARPEPSRSKVVGSGTGLP